MRRGLVCLLLALSSCDDDATKAKPVAPQAKPAPAPPPRNVPRLSVTLSAPGVSLGLDGTIERATLWRSRPAANDDSDPEASTAVLEGEALASLWSSIDALPWRGGRYDRGWGNSLELAVTRGDERGWLTHYERAPGARLLDGGITDAVEVAKQALEAALEKADAGVLTGTTTLVVPPKPPAIERKWVTEASCESHGQVVCTAESPAICFSTSSRDVYNCFSQPWAESGRLLTQRGDKPPEHIIMPLYFRTAWAVEAGSVGCTSPLDGFGPFACADQRTLTGVLPGRTRWLAHRGAGERPDQQLDWGPPVVLTRVFPRLGQLPLGQQPAPVDGFELAVSYTLHGLSISHEEVVLAGDRTGARGWLLSSRERRREAVTVRRGTLTASQVEELWKKLEALDWPRMNDASSSSADRWATSLTLTAGGVTLTTRNGGECGNCAADKAISAVEQVGRSLPEAKWATRTVTIKAPAGAKIAKGQCHDDRCKVEGENDDRRCVVAKPGLMWCPVKPWDTAGALVKTSDKVPDQARVRLWAVELDTGEKCEMKTWSRFECEGGTVVDEVLAGENGRWAAFAVREDGRAPVLVKTVWQPL